MSIIGGSALCEHLTNLTPHNERKCICFLSKYAQFKIFKHVWCGLIELKSIFVGKSPKLQPNIYQVEMFNVSVQLEEMHYAGF